MPMPLSATSDRGSSHSQSKATFSFRCIGCASITANAAQDFRCLACGNLLEITDPSWKSSSVSADSLKSIWRDRRSTNAFLDLSGVWRFRELLPAPDSSDQVISLR